MTKQTLKFNIRPVQADDNDELANMIRGVFEEFGADQPGTVYTDPTTDHLFELFQTNNAVLWVGVMDNKIVGCCGIYPTKGLPEGCSELVKFYISNEARGQGLGSLLYKQCETSALSFGVKQLYIESLPEFDKAVSIYERLGFKPLPDRLGNSGHFNCNIWLLKSL